MQKLNIKMFLFDKMKKNTGLNAYVKVAITFIKFLSVDRTLLVTCIVVWIIMLGMRMVRCSGSLILFPVFTAKIKR